MARRAKTSVAMAPAATQSRANSKAQASGSRGVESCADMGDLLALGAHV
jgi:hypothetical protein